MWEIIGRLRTRQQGEGSTLNLATCCSSRSTLVKSLSLQFTAVILPHYENLPGRGVGGSLYIHVCNITTFFSCFAGQTVKVKHRVKRP